MEDETADVNLACSSASKPGISVRRDFQKPTNMETKFSAEALETEDGAAAVEGSDVDDARDVDGEAVVVEVEVRPCEA